MRSSDPASEGDTMTEEQLFERGLQRRREVLGGEYVDANLSESDDFLMAFQRAGNRVRLGMGVEPTGPR